MSMSFNRVLMAAAVVLLSACAAAPEGATVAEARPRCDMREAPTGSRIVRADQCTTPSDPEEARRRAEQIRDDQMNRRNALPVNAGGIGRP